NQPTALSIGLVDPDGQHVFIGHRSNLIMAADGFPDSWRQAISEADAVMIYGWTCLSMGPEANLIAIEVAKEANVPVFFDPGPEISYMPPGWLEAMYVGSTVVMLTEEEAQMSLPSGLSSEEMAQSVLDLGPELVILKLGAKGMIGHTAEETLYQPGIPVEVADLTGAGDSVAASVILSYLERHALPKMLALANATGAACVQKFGSGLNVPTKAEIMAVLNKAGSEYSFS
ncbi:MAG: sugar/nucleoside kinase (ribokinase family), partial [Cellvibrionaceae bacterium]